MRARWIKAVLVGAASALSCAPAVAADPHPADFGKLWVRQHPLTVMGLQGWPQTLRMDRYQAANMNNMLAWWADGHGDDIAAAASAVSMPWHALIVDGEGDESARIQRYAAVGNAAGWMIGDEIPRSGMPWYGDLISWTKLNRPNELAYTNVLPTYATPQQLYGGTPPGGTYTYSQYLQDVIQVMHPDVLMYDHYPFLGSGTRGDYFQNLMLVRSTALEHNLPYWAFVQSYQGGGYRLPSESDVRMQVYSQLTAGYTGISYFTFDQFADASLLDANGNPTVLYPAVQALNAEVAIVAPPLRFLTSQDVRFVPGSSVQGGSANPTPSGLTNFTVGAGGDPHIQRIQVVQSGAGKDGLIGFFTDDANGHAFMLSNLYHDGTLSAAAATLQFRITFDPSVNKLVRINPTTGVQEAVALNGNELLISLTGGTARLFRYDMAPSVWSSTAGGNWSTPSNWSSGIVNSVDAEARFEGAITAPSSISLNSDIVAGAIRFDSANSYTLGGTGGITVDASSGLTTLSVAAGSHSILVPVSLGKNTLVTVASAVSTLTLTKLQRGGVTLEKAGAGDLVLNSLRLTGVNLTGGRLTVAQNGASSGVSVVTNVSIPGTGAEMDLKDNKLITRTPAGSWNGSEYTDVAGLVQSGRNGGRWNGDGIITSMPAAVSGLTTLAVATADELGRVGTSFSGEILNSGDTLVMYTYGGDANLDGKINVDDYGRIDSSIPLGIAGWYNGDFNYDGKINVDDYGIIDSNIGIQGAPFSTGGGTLVPLSAVPEPATAMLPVGAALLACSGRYGRFPRRPRPLASNMT